MTRPTQYYNNLNPTTVKEVLTSETPAIAEIKMVVRDGDLLVKALLTNAITELNGYFNISESMSATQTIEVINLICERYNFLKLSDFKLCFKNAKAGMYGKIYNRLDGQIIFEWLNTYNNDRMEVAENLNRIKHQETKKGYTYDPNDKDVNPEMQAKIKNMVKEVTKGFNDAATAIRAANKPLKRGQSDIDVFSQKWFKLFDRLHDKFGTSRFGSKYIRRYGKVISAAEFIDYKLEQWGRISEFLKARK